VCFFFFFKQKTAYEISCCDWSSDVCSSDLPMPLLYVRIELLDERSDMPRDGSGEHVVLVLEALSNGCQPDASIASQIYVALSRTGLPTNPVVDPVGRVNRGRKSWLSRCRHEGASPPGSPLQANLASPPPFRAPPPDAQS